ncbi:MAG: GNAT family N-acetyltransferase [Chloroflexota bacterium]
MMLVAKLPSEKVAKLTDEFVSVYRDAFQAAPYHKTDAEIDDFVESLERHMDYQGFRFVCVTDQQTETIMGFAYGFANRPDHFFHVEVAKVAEPDFVEAWLSNSFRLVEIAVSPTIQGHGVGGQLLDQILHRLPYKKAILATMAAETIAYKMYRNRGWQVLIDRAEFPGVVRPYRVMGLSLQ